MKFIKQTLFFVFLLASLVFLGSWGYVGHFKINTNASLSFNQQMGQFYEWTSVLAENASLADERKAWDPTEAPKHYIDIDNYPEFLNSGTIPQTLDSVIDIHGYTWVYDQGILPWATKTAFDSLQSCFERGDWEQAVLFAADLGHYVADGHMPLHITRNYNGQYTGNNGIHSRYESEMVGTYNSQIIYGGIPTEYINDANQYIFNYLYSNYNFVDSVIMADDYAENIAGNTNSNLYYSSLWNQTGDFTTSLFKNASHSLSELIYTAWMNAGCPIITSGFSPTAQASQLSLQNSPNPFYKNTTISFTLPENGNVILEILDLSGLSVELVLNTYKEKGEHELNWFAEDLPGGIYYAVLRVHGKTSIQKLVLL